MILGIHLEGPYINPEDGLRGAHPRAKLKKIQSQQVYLAGRLLYSAEENV